MMMAAPSIPKNYRCALLLTERVAARPISSPVCRAISLSKADGMIGETIFSKPAQNRDLPAFSIGAAIWRIMDWDALKVPRKPPNGTAKPPRRAIQLDSSITVSTCCAGMAWHGVARDPIRGCQYVDRAASAGLDVAIELQDAAYDPAAVTPDADEWKYQKRLF